MGKLSGKVALITGGSSGIGEATARLFAAEGARVLLTGRRADVGEAAAAGIRAAGGEARFCQADVRQPADCEASVAAALAAYGQLDILFNNAGIVPLGTALETDMATWQEVFATNVTGTFAMCRAVLPHMLARRQGVIINNGSDWSVVGGQAAVAYCATKGAVALMTRALALDHARDGIRINAVCPGDTYVERWDERRPAGQSQEDWLAAVGAAFPLGRVGTAEEIARGVLFLAGDDSSYMTGQLLVLDGGHTAGGTAVRY